MKEIKSKNIIESIIDFTRSTGFKQIVIILLFAKIWININMTNFHFGQFSHIIGLVLALLLPIALLISILLYKSHIAYFTVISISLFASFQAIDRLIRSIDGYINGNHEGLLDLIYAPSYILEERFFHAGITFSLIALLHNKSITKIYKWKSRSFIVALFLACILFLLQKLF